MSQNYGSSSTTGQSAATKFNTPAAVVGTKVSDGDEFILITRSRQSDQPQIWSSGDQQQTEQLFRQVQSHMVDSLQPTS
jgi:hypothetical protein